MPSTTLSRKSIDPEVWYTSAEAAQLLNTTARTIQRERKDNRLRGSAINGRGDLRHLGRWLLDWLDAQTERRRPEREKKAS